MVGEIYFMEEYSIRQGAEDFVLLWKGVNKEYNFTPKLCLLLLHLLGCGSVVDDPLAAGFPQCGSEHAEYVLVGQYKFYVVKYEKVRFLELVRPVKQFIKSERCHETV